MSGPGRPRAPVAGPTQEAHESRYKIHSHCLTFSKGGCGSGAQMALQAHVGLLPESPKGTRKIPQSSNNEDRSLLGQSVPLCAGRSHGTPLPTSQTHTQEAGRAPTAQSSPSRAPDVDWGPSEMVSCRKPNITLGQFWKSQPNRTPTDTVLLPRGLEPKGTYPREGKEAHHVGPHTALASSSWPVVQLRPGLQTKTP